MDISIAAVAAGFHLGPMRLPVDARTRSRQQPTYLATAIQAEVQYFDRAKHLV
jgi:hypothetical protein